MENASLAFHAHDDHGLKSIGAASFWIRKRAGDLFEAAVVHVHKAVVQLVGVGDQIR